MVSARRWPDLYVVGAGRSGTTALHVLLGQHPDLRVSAHKSPNYFAHGIAMPTWETPAAVAMARQWVGDADAYLSLFAGARGDQLMVDVSPVYLQARVVAERVAAVRPDAKIVAIVRDPAERAYAHFLGRRRDGIETTPDFGQWLDRMAAVPVPDEVAFGHYVGCSRFHHYLQPYVRLFGRERFLLLFHDDLVADPLRVVRQLLDFAEIERDVPIDTSARPNRSGEIRNPVVRRAWTASVSVRTAIRPHLPDRLRRWVGTRVLSELERPQLDPAWRAAVVEMLADDIHAMASFSGP
jgi:hypothetical protein